MIQSTLVSGLLCLSLPVLGTVQGTVRGSRLLVNILGNKRLVSMPFFTLRMQYLSSFDMECHCYVFLHIISTHTCPNLLQNALTRLEANLFAIFDMGRRAFFRKIPAEILLGIVKQLETHHYILTIIVVLAKEKYCLELYRYSKSLSEKQHCATIEKILTLRAILGYP